MAVTLSDRLPGSPPPARPCSPAASQPAFAEDPAPAATTVAAAAEASAPAATPQPHAPRIGAGGRADGAARGRRRRPDPEKAKLPVTGGVTVDFMSHYVWRGFLLTDGFAFQPTAWGKVGDFTVSSWSSWSDEDGCPVRRARLHGRLHQGGPPEGQPVGRLHQLLLPGRRCDGRSLGRVLRRVGLRRAAQPDGEGLLRRARRQGHVPQLRHQPPDPARRRRASSRRRRSPSATTTSSGSTTRRGTTRTSV